MGSARKQCEPKSNGAGRARALKKNGGVAKELTASAVPSLGAPDETAASPAPSVSTTTIKSDLRCGRLEWKTVGKKRLVLRRDEGRELVCVTT